MAIEDRFIRLPELKQITGLSRVTIWRLERDGSFPSRYRIGKTAVAYKLTEIMAWIASRQAA